MAATDKLEPDVQPARAFDFIYAKLLSTVITETRPGLAAGDATSPAPSAEPRAQHPSAAASIVRGALALLSTQPFTWAATLLSAIYVPRYLGSEILGQLTYGLTLTGIATLVVGVGIPDFLTRRAARQPQILNRGMGVSLVIRLLVAVLCVLLIGTLAPVIGPAVVDARLL